MLAGTGFSASKKFPNWMVQNFPDRVEPEIFVSTNDEVAAFGTLDWYRL
jgi:hypothetical protein